MTTTKSDLNSAVSRIERAPNVSRLVDAYDAAVGGSDVSVHRWQGRWQVWHGEYAGFCGSFSQVRTHLARTAEEILDREAEAAVPSMVSQPAQLQQACAAPAETAAKVDTAKAKVERLEARCAVLREEKNAADALVRECRKERIAAVAGEIDACPGICWTNEERAETAADEAQERLDRCLGDYWEACDYLRDEDREERRTTLKARIAQGPAMVLQPVQLQQANAARSPTGPFDALALKAGYTGTDLKLTTASTLYAVHGPDGIQDPILLSDLIQLRSLLRACGNQRVLGALELYRGDRDAVSFNLQHVEDLYRRLAELVGHQLYIHDYEVPVEDDQIPF